MAMEEALIKRILPHSDEAERAVVGSMLMDQDAIVTASEIISADDFYQRQYGILFEVVTELYQDDKAVDLVTLQERLKNKDVPPELSSVEFISGIINGVPTSANVKNYAEVVAEKALLRRMIRTHEELANTCYLGKEPVDQILEDTEKKIFDLLQRKSSDDFVPIKDVVLSVIDRIEAAAKHKGTVTGLATGFYDLDYKTSGFQPCQTIYGKDGLCSESGPVYCCKKSCDDSHFQFGDVQGSACESYSFHGVQS